jgi:alginate O-acetyltransferase complex protein AlgI
MLFNTPLFLLFLLSTFSIYYFLKGKPAKIFLLFSSYVFYGYWDYRFLFLLIGSSLMDYYFGKLIFETKNVKNKKWILQFSLLINLTILGFFKYYNFFIDSVSSLLPSDLDYLHLNVLLPVGISFYTFQSLSYTFDIYRGKLNPAESVLDYCLFVGIFPHMVSGPIVKAKDLLPQLRQLQRPVKSDYLSGFSLITVGMFQKVLIGDTAAKHVDHIFAEPTYYASAELLFAALMFSIQIYADFSGYSKIARGSARLFGIELINNFQQPYLSTNITDFWRRWHISLSEWLRDYVYIWWLGGNRITKIRTYINLFLTMLIGGFWHGANWTFVVWGGLHGVYLIVHKIMRGETREIEDVRGGYWYSKILGIFFTYMLVVFAWLFFRSPDLSTAHFFINRILFEHVDSLITIDIIEILLAYSTVTLLLDLLEINYKRQDYLVAINRSLRMPVFIIFWGVILLYMYSVGKPMPFIYFQF